MNPKWKWLIVSLVVAGIVAITFVTSPAPQKSFLEKARRVASTTNWCKSDDQQYTPSQWLTESNMFALRRNADGRRCAVSVNLANGIETPLAAFNMRFSQRKAAPAFWELSPDRKWMLWIDHALPKTWNAATLDGSKYIIWPQPKSQVDWDMPIAQWACDSDHWAETQGSWLNVHSLSQPRITKTTFVVPPQNMSIDFLCGFDTKNQAIFEASGAGLQLFTVSLKSATAYGHLSSALASRGYLSEIELSPQATKVAWLCENIKNTPAFLQWLPRILRPHLWDRPIVEAWVADMSGSHIHCLGYVEGYDGDLKDLHWSPNGEKLSFRRQNALYVLPVN
jgi:hypothetical protein